MRWFDYEGVAREAGIPDDKLAELVRMTREEYGDDDMLFELRMLRTCSAIRDGYATVEDALKPDPLVRRRHASPVASGQGAAGS